jgi:hypothetical protein
MAHSEAVALGLSGCFGLLGLDSISVPAVSTACWRVVLNLAALHVLDHEPAPSTSCSAFILYTTLCRAWQTVSRLMQPELQEQAERAAAAAASGTGGAASRRDLNGLWRGPDETGRQFWQQHHQQLARRGLAVGRDVSALGNPEPDQAVYTEDDEIPGLQRGLFEDEVSPRRAEGDEVTAGGAAAVGLWGRQLRTAS